MERYWQPHLTRFRSLIGEDMYMTDDGCFWSTEEGASEEFDAFEMIIKFVIPHARHEEVKYTLYIPGHGCKQ